MSQWLVLLAISSLSALVIPINKRLWSASFVTSTACAAYLLLGLLYLLMDVYECQRTFLLRLLVSAGKNPILLYCGHSLITGLLPWHFSVDNSSHLQLLLRLTWATLVWLLLAHYLSLKGLYVRI